VFGKPVKPGSSAWPPPRQGCLITRWPACCWVLACAKPRRRGPHS